MQCERGGADGFLRKSCAEDDLIDLTKQGDRRAFEKLMSDHLKILYNYTAMHVKAAVDAEDILQETMLAIWKGISGFQNASSFRTWCIGILKRKIADYYREAYRVQSVSIDEMEYLPADDSIEASDTAVTLESAIGRLSAVERELVFLAYTAQCSYREISEILEIPIGTIKSKISSVKSKLRKFLGKENNSHDL